MRIVLWMGNEPNQKALAHKIAKHHDVVGLVVETRISKQKLTPRQFLEKAIGKVFLSKINNAWSYQHAHYRQKYSGFPDINTLEIENINSDGVIGFTEAMNPDLIVVSGTRLIKNKTLSVRPPKGIINLHTGLSPYIKGGPNCTNWCISTNQFHLIGNTIMWIDEGIDTGNIIATELTKLDQKDSLNDIHLKVMEHAHDLYIRSIDAIRIGNVPNVKQSDIAMGTTYYTRQWNLRSKINLIRNLKKNRSNINSEETKSKQSALVLVNLSGAKH